MRRSDINWRVRGRDQLTKNKRSPSVSRTRPRTFRRNMMS